MVSCCVTVLLAPEVYHKIFAIDSGGEESGIFLWTAIWEHVGCDDYCFQVTVQNQGLESNTQKVKLKHEERQKIESSLYF